jgi:hypothetical protein
VPVLQDFRKQKKYPVGAEAADGSPSVLRMLEIRALQIHGWIRISIAEEPKIRIGAAGIASDNVLVR